MKEFLDAVEREVKTEEFKTRYNEARQVAATIVYQLGGRRFIAMTGAKNFIVLPGKGHYGMQFSIGRNCAGVNRIMITLNEGLDLYDMEFFKESMNHKTYDTTHKTIKKFEGVYFDQLQELFTSVTGMYTSL
jgi:hypothetical protein